jgi:hypothetical protein
MRQTKTTPKEKNKNKQHKILSNKITTKKNLFIQNFITKYFLKILINNYRVIIRISKLNINI